MDGFLPEPTETSHSYAYLGSKYCMQQSLHTYPRVGTEDEQVVGTIHVRADEYEQTLDVIRINEPGIPDRRVPEWIP